MTSIALHRRFRPGALQALLAPLVALLAVGCVTTTSLARPADLATLQDPPARLSVRSVGDPAWLPIVNYRATNDSLIGIIEGSALPGYPLKRLELPYDSLAEVRIKRTDALRSASVVAVPGALFGMIFWILGAP